MINIQSLHAGYGKLQILHDINLTFAADRFTAVLGANGSGKSTLMKSIFSLTSIFSGSITYSGKSLINIPTESISKLGLAYVPQRENVFTELSIHENLLLGVRRLKKHDAEMALSEAYDLFPILAKRQRQLAGQLSGGERQMLAIAVAWLTHPTFMLLDEPSAGLAPLVANEVFGILQTLSSQGMSFVVVEQNARRILQYCDEVYILREGQLAFNGIAEACLQDEETVKSYLGMR